jgi:hypothetical protein
VNRPPPKLAQKTGLEIEELGVRCYQRWITYALGECHSDMVSRQVLSGDFAAQVSIIVVLVIRVRVVRIENGA